MNVVTQENIVETKAVVIMYGWFGAVSRHLEKYVDLYVNHPQHKCSVIYGTAPEAAIMTHHVTKLATIVMDGVRKAVRISQSVENAKGTGTAEIPIILHYFSNGGAFVAERFNCLVQDAISGSMKNSQDAEDLKFVHKRLATRGYEILDSAPAYIYEDSAYRVIDASNLNLPFNLFLKSIVCVAIVLFKISSFVFQQKKLPEIFWNNMLESTLCQRQVFIYSSIDKLTDAEKLDEFIRARKKRGIDVKTVKFEDSDHVLHMKKHPKEYTENVLDHVLSVVLQDSTNSTV